MSPITSFSVCLSMCVCLRVCECVSVCLQAGASADLDSQISCTVGCAQTDIFCLGLAASPGRFHKYDNFGANCE